MDYEQIITEINSLKTELEQQTQPFLIQAMDKNGFHLVILSSSKIYIQIPRAHLEQMRQDLGFEEKETKHDFLANFPSAFLLFLKSLQAKQSQTPQNKQQVEQLFSSSFYPYDLPAIKKHQILELLIQDLNASIHSFYMAKRDKLQALISSQKTIQKNHKGMPTNILKLIQRNKAIKKEEYNENETKTNINPTDNSPISDASTEQQVINFQHCICNQEGVIAISNLLKAKSPKVQCTICQHYFHCACLKMTNTNINYRYFMCPSCVIHKIDPLNQIVDVLYKASLFQPSVHIPWKNMNIQIRRLQPYEKLEIRCLKLDGKNGSEECTWPDLGELSVNGRKVMDFRPLQSNSSLKKRKDEKYSTMDIQQNETNVIQIKEGSPSQDQRQSCRIESGQNYYLGVFLVRTLQAMELIEQIRGQQERYMSIQDSKELIRENINRCRVDDIVVERVTVSLICQFEMRMIETPVRGILCSHIQCFSLENMVQMMQKVNPRKWRCPICKSKCFEMYIDSYQLMAIKIINEKKLKLEEISFNKDGIIEEQEVQTALENGELWIAEFMRSNENRMISLEMLKKKESEAVIQAEIQYLSAKVIDETMNVKQIEPEIRKQVCKSSVVDKQEKQREQVEFKCKYWNQGDSKKNAICID